MMDLKGIDRALAQYIRPQTFPLAIRMVKSGEALPDMAKRPHRDLNGQITTCMGYTMARRYGWMLAMSQEDINCPLSKVVYGFEEEVDYFKEGCTCAGMYTATKEAGAKTEAGIATFSWKEYENILCAPLSRTSFEPHVILVYGNSAQVMMMAAAYLYNSGGRVDSSFAARIDCSDSVIMTMRTKLPQVILPCYGDRVFGQTQDHEMAFSFPADDHERILEGLEGAHRGGVRYPIPTYLRYQPSYPPSYQRLEQIWAERGDPKGTAKH